jgi:hypothetical protein
MMPQSNGTAWEAIRRALARWISTVQVQALVPAETGEPFHVAEENCLVGETCAKGRRESEIAPQADVRTWASPQAEPGGMNADLCAVAVVVGLDAALQPEEMAVYAHPACEKTVATHGLPLGERLENSVTVSETSVSFLLGHIHAMPMRSRETQVASLPISAPDFPHRPRFPLRLGRREVREDNPVALPVTVRSRMAVTTEIPMRRKRRPVPAGLSFAEAFAAERRDLARASQVDLGDVALLGIYPQVPLAAVGRLGLDENGAELSLWLKQEALAGAAQGKMPRLVTMIVGRVRSTGRMIQTVG